MSAERTAPLKLTNKDIRLIFDEVCELIDKKHNVYFDDGPESYAVFSQWVDVYIVDSTNKTLKELLKK